MSNQNTKVINIARLHPISKIIPTNTKNTVNGKAVADYVEETAGGSKIEAILENKISAAVEEYKQYLLDNFLRGAVVTPSTLPVPEDRKEDFNYFIIPDEGDIPIPPEPDPGPDPELPKPEEVRYVRDISYPDPVVYGSDDGIDYSNVKRIYIDVICSTGVAYDLDSISLITNWPGEIPIYINNKEMTWGIIVPDNYNINTDWFNKEGYDLTSFTVVYNDGGEIELVPQYEQQYNGEMILNITTSSNNFKLNLFDYIGGNSIDDAIIDWGDGSDTITIDSSTLELSHTYSTAGDYQLKIKGSIKWKGKDQASATYSLSKCLTSIELPTNNSPIVDIGRYGFRYFTKLTTIPSGLFDNCPEVTTFDSCFNGCSSLQSIPEGLFDKCTAVISFYYCFAGCSSLQSIPEGLFDNNTEVDSFIQCFSYCSSLQSIPEGLFDNNTLVTDFIGCFYSCKTLQSIPEGLFDNNTLVTHFGRCFWNCTSLQSIPEGLFDNNTAAIDFSGCFYNCPIQTIPEGLFDNNTAVINFGSCFHTCSSLQSIPEGLFDNCTKVTNFSYCFDSCSSLQSIPEGLFDNNTVVTSFESCFHNCTSLRSIPSRLFGNNTKVTNFYSCFDNCTSVTSNLPTLWISHPNATHNYCFYNCTKASNYQTAVNAGWT